MTYEEYFDQIWGGIEVYAESQCKEEEEDELPDLQSEVDPYLVIEALARVTQDSSPVTSIVTKRWVTENSRVMLPVTGVG